ncbi:MAG: aminotransferase class IV [Arcobacteraceae bacterium]|jgi:4-amino-4-deoxychorismate lyase
MTNIYFETIRCDDFEVFNLEYHKKRIAKTVGLNINLEEYIYPPSECLTKCKLQYDSNHIIQIDYSTYVKKQIRSFKVVFDDTIEYSKKYIDRHDIEKLYQKKDNCDEIIIVKNNLVTDTSIANIAILYKNRWITPKKPILHGTTRARYIDEELLVEEDIDIDMLLNANKIGLLNAMIDFDIIDNFKIDLTRNQK